MITSDYFHVTADVEVNGERKRIDLSGLLLLPHVGDEVHLDYWHGLKLSFEVEAVRHHISDIGEKMLQQVTVIGKQV